MEFKLSMLLDDKALFADILGFFKQCGVSGPEDDDEDSIIDVSSLFII
jgi:hypothetical protein